MTVNSARANLTEWPTFRPVWRNALFTFALLLCPTIFWIQLHFALNEAQQFYLRDFTRSYIVGGIRQQSVGHYEFLNAVLNNGAERIAFPEEFCQGIGSDGTPVLAATELAQAHHIKQFHWIAKTISNRYVHAVLETWIYPNVHWRRMAEGAVVCGFSVFILGLPGALSMDKKRLTSLKRGRRIEGPEMINCDQFWRRQIVKNGFRYHLPTGLVYTLITDKRVWFSGFNKCMEHLQIRKEHEREHAIYLADTGKGKSLLLKQNLWQITARKEAAIVYDPGAQFLPAFYDPGTDIILNPMDTRFPGWELRNEIATSTDAEVVAASLFPSLDVRNKFFEDAPRRILKHLLLLRPSNTDLIQWLTDPREINKRIRGTELAYMVDEEASEQRAGVLASLGMIADALRLIPPPAPGMSPWSTADWAKSRKGLVFITSNQLNRDQLKPLTTLWMDLLILRTMTDSTNASRQVWYIIDEAGSLGYMASLKRLLTESRKANCAVVLAAQNPADFSVYGEHAKVMLSQPRTKVFLCTSGREGSEFASESIGKIKLERFREAHSSSGGWWGRTSVSYQQETVVEPLVMASVIAGLPSLHGFFKHGNDVVRIELPITTYPERHLPFIEREEASNANSAEPESLGRPSINNDQPDHGADTQPFFE